MKRSNTSESSSRGSSILRSPQERKQDLKRILTRTQGLKESINVSTVRILDSYMQEADSINSETTLHEKIHNQDEVLIDSEVMSVSSNILRYCTRAFTKKMGTYDYTDFAKKQVEYARKLSDCQESAMDWSLLGAEAIPCFKTTPQYTTLLGTLAPLERKEIKQRVPRVKEALAPIKAPTKVTTVEEEGGNVEQTVKIRKMITRSYKATGKPIDFFKLILHPTNFGKTIENMLHISFLIRDGEVQISKDSSGKIVIQPCSKDMIAKAKAQKDANVQNVTYIDMQLWKELNKAYQLQKPIIDS